MMVSKEGRGFMPRLRDNCAKGAGSTAIMAPGDRMGADQQQDIEEGCRAHTRQHFGQMPGDKLGEAQFGSDNAYAQTGGDKEDDAQVDFFDAGG